MPKDRDFGIRRIIEMNGVSLSTAPIGRRTKAQSSILIDEPSRSRSRRHGAMAARSASGFATGSFGRDCTALLAGSAAGQADVPIA